jgi:steroid 5-alpha reductase family enzyme
MGVLLANAATVLILMLGLWLVSLRIGDPSFIDAAWGFGFVVIAWVTFALTDAGPDRRPLLVAVTTVWGLRLAGYLFWRWRRNGPDRRYVAMLRRASNPKLFTLTKVFLLQGALMFVVSLPVQLGQIYEHPSGLGVAQYAGLALAVLGVASESIADLQLVRFKADPANDGAVLDRGLWRYTRHPNYFGDFCTWWGLFLISLSATVTLVGVVGPLVMSFLLMRWSGVGPLESHLRRRKPGYEDYVRRTSGFFPRPPRKPEILEVTP